MSEKPLSHPRRLYRSYDLLDRIPIPGWLLDLLVVLVIAIATHLIAWQSGYLQPGQVDLYLAVPGLYLVLIPSCWFILANRATHDINSFYSDVEVDLFKPERIYKLSNYGGFASATLLLLFYILALISFPEFVLTTYGVLTQLFIFFNIILLFFAPISGINSRMKQSKEELLAAANEDLRDIHKKIHAAVKTQDYATVDNLKGVFTTL